MIDQFKTAKELGIELNRCYSEQAGNEVFQDRAIIEIFEAFEKRIREDQERITAENTKEDCIKAIQEIPCMVDHSKCVNLQTVINAIFESKTIKD